MSFQPSWSETPVCVSCGDNLSPPAGVASNSPARSWPRRLAIRFLCSSMPTSGWPPTAWHAWRLFWRSPRRTLPAAFLCQETGTLVEKLVIPLIHFVLLGFLPLARMRRSRHPAYAAGCGQFFLARRSAYEAAGGHTAIQGSLHDGITLPRAFRAAGFRTDLCDMTEIATCRMYQSARDVWLGLAKNATEGLASPGMIVPATAFLLGGQVLPFALLAAVGLAPTSGSMSCLNRRGGLILPAICGGAAISSIVARRCAAPGRNPDLPRHSVARVDSQFET